MSIKKTKTIKIGALNFKIEEVNDPPFEAQIDHRNCRIRLNDSMGSQMREVSLWHEVVHSILAQAGFHEHDEAMVEALGFGIVGALKDNQVLRMS